MTWMDWVLVALFTLSAIVTVATVGQPRPRITPSFAAMTVFLNGLVIVGIVTVG